MLTVLLPPGGNPIAAHRIITKYVSSIFCMAYNVNTDNGKTHINMGLH